MNDDYVCRVRTGLHDHIPEGRRRGDRDDAGEGQARPTHQANEGAIRRQSVAQDSGVPKGPGGEYFIDLYAN